MSYGPPRVAYEERGPNHAIIWYERTRRPAGAGPSNGHDGRAARLSPGLKLALAVPSWGRPCGVAEYSRGLLRGLQAIGLEPQVLTGGEELADLAREQGMRLVHFQHEYSLWDPHALRRQALALLRAGVRTVATVHALAPGADQNSVLGECFDALIVHSPALRDELCAALRVPPRRVHVIPMGVEPRDPGDRTVLRARLGLGQEPAIGFVGFFYPQKGIVELVRAARELRRTIPGLRCLVFASVAPNEVSRRCREEVAARLAAEGLAGEAEFQDGYLPEQELVARLSALDVIVLPYAEYPTRQLSAAAKTAIAACRPVVVTDVFAFSDLGDEVYRIASNHPEAIAAGVSAVLADAERQEALVAACRRYVEHNSWSRVAVRHLLVYRSL